MIPIQKPAYLTFKGPTVHVSSELRHYTRYSSTRWKLEENMRDNIPYPQRNYRKLVAVSSTYILFSMIG